MHSHSRGKLMIVAGHQPNYLPWLGFFDKMVQCDVFIIEDNVQFERQGFTNRTKIKTFQGVRWLTVPVKHSGNSLPINEITIADTAGQDWAKQHWLMLKSNYSRAPFWGEFNSFFEQTYSQKWNRLMDLNMRFIKGFMDFFKIKRRLVFASSLGVSGKKSELVLAQCKALGATKLFSGIGAQNYLNLQRFEEEGIKVVFQDFQHPVYPQLGEDFVPGLSAVDYLFWAGGKIWKPTNVMLQENKT
jgi:hypothetical protein